MTETAVGAQAQTTLAPEDLLNSVNSGVVVERTAQLRAQFRSVGKKTALELAEQINHKHQGAATVFVYEEAFGRRDRLHWLLHLRSLHDYAAVSDLFEDGLEGTGEGAGTDPMYVDGSVTETLLIPQHWGMYGTDEALPEGAGIDTAKPNLVVPPAAGQTSLPADSLVHSGNSEIVIHRSAVTKYAFRAEARMFARQITEDINTHLPGVSTSFLFEEAFGGADHVHWLIHMKDLDSYYDLIDMHQRMDQATRDIYLNEIIAPAKGGGTWNRIFVEGSMGDVAFTPLRPDRF
ncbi:DUF6039 family protein [Actinokineospora spheciospongiae]|uniref:DUF6039 family protein n=1 Tax=Actinokineospora spheciospongiae TaxID=909613 RepID=UPI000D70AF3B|nr:DUF6039 family protein [Actinokineospora spheciospongiae]PWW64695.1 hypothetical protein DFQ13_103669 [Actinokineospora spheciospongiae]